MEIDYPLSRSHVIEIKIGEKGITRQRLMDIAAQGYHYVYSFVSEDKNENDPEYNFFGIWGHGMGDLTIHTFYVHENNRITLGVDS